MSEIGTFELGLVAGTFAAAGAAWAGTMINTHNQKKQLRLQAELEITKILTDGESRQSRILLYEVYSTYKKHKNLNVYQITSPKNYHLGSSTVRADFDLAGSLLSKRKEFLMDFLDTWIQTTIVCYKASKPVIDDVRIKTKYGEYMKFFEWLYKEAEIEWKWRYPDIPSPEPY